ncbi:MAG: hypothetical protein L6Q95_06950 [Planctomycetes bacterium]|nr:hypothetical protein [Planctomycetota bacterium]
MGALRRTARARKVAISLPARLHEDIQRERRESGLSRSAIIVRALEDMLARRRREPLIERYVEGYRRMPESAAEVEAARSAAAELLAQEPWE